MISRTSITSFKTIHLKRSCCELLGSGLQRDGIERGQNSAHSSGHAFQVWDEETRGNKEGNLKETCVLPFSQELGYS